MKINLRWFIQAVAFVGCIYFFMQIWDVSRNLIAGYNFRQFISLIIYLILFVLCFFVMALTSYLKQKLNGTLKNSIPFFERLIDKCGMKQQG